MYKIAQNTRKPEKYQYLAVSFSSANQRYKFFSSMRLGGEFEIVIVKISKNQALVVDLLYLLKYLVHF